MYNPNDAIRINSSSISSRYKSSLKLLGPGTSGSRTMLIISNEKMKGIVTVVRSFEYHSLLIKGVTGTIENETKEQLGGFLGMLLGILGWHLLGNILAGKGMIRESNVVHRDGKILNSASSFN